MQFCVGKIQKGRNMASYSEMSKEELLKEKQSLEEAYHQYEMRDLSLNMARGKPSAAQLDLSNELLTALKPEDEMISREALDIRNYGGLEGLQEAKELLASMIDEDPDNMIVYGNSSLNIMYDTVSRSMTHGVLGNTPWCKLPEVKFLCPVPGYDRHFAVTEHFGITMINIPMTDEGPDMDLVEKYVSEDEAVKGIWCVPKYSNPQGVVYSDEVVRRMANLSPKAKDFRVYWDNAYCVHDLYEEIPLLSIMKEAKKAGKEDMIYEFVSTSKVSFSGAGIGGICTSSANKKDILKSLTIQTIGFDKVNQMRHVKFFKDGDGVRAHMKKHAALLRPKFEMVLNRLEEDLAGKDCGSWITPKGGYFITFEAKEGCATRIIQLAKEAGVTMTGAGAPFPYHKDPKDSVIRIAPSLPTEEELSAAAEIFTTCVRLATVEKLLEV